MSLNLNENSVEKRLKYCHLSRKMYRSNLGSKITLPVISVAVP